MEKQNKFWILPFSIFWFLLVLSGYYLIHKPFTTESTIPFGGFLLNVLLASGFVILLGGIGRKLIPTESSTTKTAFVLQFALGLGVFAFFWLLLGIFGLYYHWLSYLFLLAGLILFRKESMGWLRQIGSLFGAIRSKSWWFKIFLSAIFVLLLMQLLLAASPPLKYDALTYHLQLPRQYNEQHGFVFASQNPYWGHPQLVELLYTFMTLLAGGKTAAVFGALSAFVMLIGVFAFVAEWIEEHDLPLNADIGGLVAVLSLLAGLTFRDMIAWAYTDLFSALLGLCVLISFLLYLRGSESKWLFLSALFGGLALGTKLTAALIMLPLGFWLLRDILRKKIRFQDIFYWGVIFLITASPWFLKNWVTTGNPLYPYFLPTEWVDTFRLQSASAVPRDMNILSNIFAPFTATWLGVEASPGFGTDIGPLFLLLIPFALFWFRKEEKVRFLFLVLLCAWLCLSLGGIFFIHLQQTRLYYVFFPALAVLAALGWAALQNLSFKSIRLGMLANVLVGLVLLLAIYQDISRPVFYKALEVHAGVKPQNEYLTDNLGWYSFAMEELGHLPADARVLMLWEGRGYYAPYGTTADVWIDQFRIGLQRDHTPEEMLNTWRIQGYSHVLINISGAEFLRENPNGWQEDWHAYDEMLLLLDDGQWIGEIYFLAEIGE